MFIYSFPRFAHLANLTHFTLFPISKKTKRKKKGNKKEERRKKKSIKETNFKSKLYIK